MNFTSDNIEQTASELHEALESLSSREVYAKARVEAASNALRPTYDRHLYWPGFGDPGPCSCAFCLAYRILNGVPS